MELRDLRAFVAAAQELHFARAAALLYMSPSAMSELIRRLEQELGTPLFTRSTRRITLTDAGTELLGRAEAILNLTAQATASVAAVGRGNTGAVRLGVTPPAAHVLAPHLVSSFTAATPDCTVHMQRMWLPVLGAALEAGTIDAAVTCGDLAVRASAITTIEIGAQPLLIGLRPGHPLAGDDVIDLRRLGNRLLGLHSAQLFPAWHGAQRRILADAGLAPPTVELEDTDLSARLWTRQPEVEWIMLIASLLTGHANTVTRPAQAGTVPFTLSWPAQPSPRAVVRRFIEFCRAAELPPGWIPGAPGARGARGARGAPGASAVQPGAEKHGRLHNRTIGN